MPGQVHVQAADAGELDQNFQRPVRTTLRQSAEVAEQVCSAGQGRFRDLNKINLKAHLLSSEC